VFTEAIRLVCTESVRCLLDHVVFFALTGLAHLCDVPAVGHFDSATAVGTIPRTIALHLYRVAILG